MNTKYCAIVVFLCVVIPVMAGMFVWPTSDTEETTWTASEDRQMNITESVKTSLAPTVTAYNGVNNNIFLLGENGSYRTEPASTTTTPSAYPNVVESSYTSVTSSDIAYGVHEVTLDSLRTTLETIAENDGKDLSRVYMMKWGGATNSALGVIYEGQHYNALLLYPNGNAFVLEYSPYFDDKMIPVIEQDLMYSLQDDSLLTYYDAPAGTYADVSKGYTYTGADADDEAYWVNGYVNHTATFLVHNEGLSSMGFAINGESYALTWRYSNNLQAVGPDDSTHLGSASVYDYALVLIDADRGKVIIYGLMGMTSFTDPYTDHLGNNVVYDYGGGTFTSVTIYGNTFTYFVAGASVENGTELAIVDAVVEPKDYYFDNEWAFVIKNPSVMGDSLSFTNYPSGAPNVTWTKYPITSGKIAVTFEGDDEPTEVAVRNIVIAHIETADPDYPNVTINQTYINGRLLAGNIEQIRMDGVWDANVYVTDLDWTSVTHYSWDSTVFGLDMTSFCAVGLLTAIGCFLFFGFVMRREGSEVLAMMVSAGCGLVYLVLMMA